MHKILIYVCAMCFWIGCSKDQSDPDIVNNPTSTILFIGDSLIYWGDWSNGLDDFDIKNYGVGGNTTNDLYNRLNAIIDEKPCAVFIMIGINDLRRDIPIDIIKSNYQNILLKTKHFLPNSLIYINSLLPVNPESDINQNANISTLIIEMNQWLRLKQEEFGYNYINIYDSFHSGDNFLKSELTTDGLHLNDKGYEKWYDILRSHIIYIRSLYKNL